MGNNTAIQSRHDTAANWTTDNPTLAAGELGLETDTNRIKFGDGTTAWTSLPYVGAGGNFKYARCALSASQTANLAVNDHIQWDTVESGSLSGLQTGAGQANGIFTLAANKTYKISVNLRVAFTGNTGDIGIHAYNRTNSSYIGTVQINIDSVTVTTNVSSQSCGDWIVEVGSTPIDIDIRIIASTAVSNIQTSRSYMMIEEYGGY